MIRSALPALLGIALFTLAGCATTGTSDQVGRTTLTSADAAKQKEKTAVFIAELEDSIDKGPKPAPKTAAASAETPKAAEPTASADAKPADAAQAADSKKKSTKSGKKSEPKNSKKKAR